MSEKECRAPYDPPEGSWHVISQEVGDGATRSMFVAKWERGLWSSYTAGGLLPREAARATWVYRRPLHDAEIFAAFGSVPDVESYT